MLSDDSVTPGFVSAVEEILRDSDPDGRYGESCARLLHLLRRQVGMESGWTSEFVGALQVIRVVDNDPTAPGPTVGGRTPLSDTFCTRVLNGTMPALIPDTAREPAAVWLELTFPFGIGSYLGVPLHSPDGTPDGMLCLTSGDPSPHLDAHALRTARLVATAIDRLHLRALGTDVADQERATLRAEIADACAGNGRWSVFQPIVELQTGLAVAAEGLTRFEHLGRTPAGWFAAAHSVGLGAELEVASARGVLERLRLHSDTPPLTVTLSPEVAATSIDDVLDGVDVAHVVLELADHTSSGDDDALDRALAPHRRAGMMLALDNARTGYSTWSPVARLHPDLVKIDMSLVRDVDTDPERQARNRAMAALCSSSGALAVAEGVENDAEMETLVDLGVILAQGYLFGRPSTHPTWTGLTHHAPSGLPLG